MISKNDTIHFNSLTFLKLNFVLYRTIFSVTVAFFQRPKSKFWPAEKIEHKLMTCFAFVIVEIFSFKVRIFFFSKSNSAISWTSKELISLKKMIRANKYIKYKKFRTLNFRTFYFRTLNFRTFFTLIVHVDFIWQTCWINFVAKNKCF